MYMHPYMTFEGGLLQNGKESHVKECQVENKILHVNIVEWLGMESECVLTNRYSARS